MKGTPIFQSNLKAMHVPNEISDSRKFYNIVFYRDKSVVEKGVFKRDK